MYTVDMYRRLLANNPLILFVPFFLLLWIIDTWLGNNEALPQPWFTHLWFGESVAIVFTGIILLLLRKHFTHKLPWFLAAFAVMWVGIYIINTNPDFYNQPPDQYRSKLGRIYYTYDLAVPYTTPFYQDYDHSLFSDAPDFLKMQIFLFIPLALGYSIDLALKHRNGKRTFPQGF